MSIQGGPDIVENGLILCYDPANIDSYVSGSTTMYDLGSTGNTASLVGGVEYTGSFKGIFNFDGMNDYINIARPSSISTSGSFSVCMFAKWKTVGTTTSSIQTLLDNNHNSSPVQGFVLQDRPELSKKLSFSVRPDQVGATSSFYVGNNNWYHIAGTHDGTVTRLYINGVLDGFASQSGGISTVQPDITIARSQASSGSRHMRGNIGQTLIYNRSLSELEVRQNYNAVKGRYPFSPLYPPDPYFENVTLLLSGERENAGQNNTFIDSSTNAFAITRNGNTTQGTFSPYGDNWSNYFDGNGDYLTAPDNAAFDFGTGDFTIEAWVYIAGNSGLDSANRRDAGIFCPFATTGTLDGSYAFQIKGDANTTGTGIDFVSYQSGGEFLIVATTTVSQNVWHHIAVARSGTTTRLFLNGSQVGSGTLGNQNVNTVNAANIGRLGYTGYLKYFNGYISNLRVLKGTALYTSNFTPPTAPLTAITNTSLLTCHSNRFRDASSNNFAITRNGDVSVQRVSPFSPPTAYATSTIGGSGYFDGTGDYLSVSSNAAFSFGTGDFTIECFFYPLSVDTTQYLYILDSTGGIAFGFEPVSSVASFVLGRRATAVDLSAAYTIVPFQWLHLVAVRSGTTAALYINGTRVATGTNSLNYTVSGPVNVGSISTVSTYEANGYISNLSVVKGTAVYNPTQTTLTVPTSPLTAITNTSLLLNFTNAAIIDSAMLNTWETVNSTQISTTVTKYGNGSIYNPAGSSLRANSIVQNAFGTGDFTIEFWLYPLGSQFGTPISNWTGPGNWAFLFEGQQITFSGPAAGYQVLVKDPTNITLNAWTHIAVSRASGTMRLFRNGVSVASASNSTNFTAAGKLSIGSLYGDGASWQFNGYYDDIRITAGVARYVGNFTPPAAALPDL